ncbi:MAG: hypothetical protein RJA22_784 [Verrucomicrobiota bacterium]|jgi:hypothetical protein
MSGTGTWRARGRASWIRLAAAVLAGGALGASAQIDPTKRELVQLGYNQPLEGQGPIAAYAFYFMNRPGFLEHSNLTLRLAVAPVYMDSEVGFGGALGQDTDLALGLAGGGFADSYAEVRDGNYRKSESFLGHGTEVSSSIYHHFNPAARIPLHGVVRVAARYAAYAGDQNTADDFEVPDDQVSFRVRAGLRFGGREPVMMPELAMELSAWYIGEARTDPHRYGFDDDRAVNRMTHQFWARGLLTYTLPESHHNFGIMLTSGTGLKLDRFSAYRLGGNLPLYSEFPLTLPGYYFQELSAESFVLLGATYNLPVDRKQRFWLNFTGSTGGVDYLEGFEEPRKWHSGLGGGLVYRTPTDQWQVALGYGYGFNARRDGGYGAQSLLLLVQFDWHRTKTRFFDPTANVGRSRGLDSLMRSIFR